MLSSKRVKFNIEFAHLYDSSLEDPDHLKKDVQLTIQIVDRISRAGMSSSLNVLIDDYSVASNYVDPGELVNTLKELGLPPDYVVMESEMTQLAERFLEFLPERLITTSEDHTIFHSIGNDVNLDAGPAPARRYKSQFMERAMAKTGESEKKKRGHATMLRQQRCHSDSAVVLSHTTESKRRFSCPLLTACWYLCRLGVPQFTPRFAYEREGANPFVGGRIITVLPTSFLKVESTAVELISLSRTKTISKRRKQIEYYFY